MHAARPMVVNFLEFPVGEFGIFHFILRTFLSPSMKLLLDFLSSSQRTVYSTDFHHFCRSRIDFKLIRRSLGAEHRLGAAKRRIR